MLEQMQINWASGELGQYKQFILRRCHATSLIQTTSLHQDIYVCVYTVPGNH